MRALRLSTAKYLLLALIILLASMLPAFGARAESVIATGYVTSKTLNMRGGPNTDNKIVETLTLGAKVSVYAVSGTWLKITADASGKNGYVSGKYITLNADSAGAYGLGTVTGSVHLRKEATSKSESIEVLKEGASVTVFSADSTTGWYSVSVHDTKLTGYLSPKYVKIVTKFKKSSSAASGSTAKITGSGVNLRKGPSKDDTSITKLAKGTALTVTGSSGNWYQVKVTSTGTSGYVSKNYVSLTAASTSSSGVGFTNASRVNLRKGPSKDDSSLGKLSKHTALTVIETTGKWSKVKITSTGTTGYIFSSYITLGTVSKTAAPTATPAATVDNQAAYINASGVNLRTGASSDSASLGTLSKNTLITAVSKTGSWYKVKITSTGTSGYVYKTYVTLGTP